MAAARVAGWGWCAVSASAAGVCAAVVGGSDRNSAVGGVDTVLGGREPGPANARRGLEELTARLRGHGGDPVQLDLAGTKFQREVWRALARVEPGETITYADLAVRMGRTGASARAVGSAVGANPALVLIPCHRVVPAGGGIGGYRLGTDLKEKLLAAERGGRAA